MVTASIQKVENALGSRWVCRLSEPGGYVWHGQVAHTSFDPNATRESFTDDCRRILGDFRVTEV